MLRLYPFLACLLLWACQSNTTQSSPVVVSIDTVKKEVPAPADTIAVSAKPVDKRGLALSSNALMLINTNSGSTTEIVFGMEQGKLVQLINKTLELQNKTITENRECGAGVLQFAEWPNGLVLVFDEDKKKTTTENKVWKFAGWHINSRTANTESLKTMANVGLGTSKSELELAYTVTYQKTSLGQEFSTSAGLYGIISEGKDGKVTEFWSGANCIFR